MVGSTAISLGTARRGETIDGWFPVLACAPTAADADLVGELNLSVRIEEHVVLPLEEYDELRRLLLNVSVGSTELIYDLVAEMPAELERIADALVRIYVCNDQLVDRTQHMADFEIDGDPGGAHILFRSKSLLTKTLELYLRLAGSEFLIAAVGDVVGALCADGVELEIDPTRLPTGPKERSLAENAKDLGRWTTYLWNSLYQSRHHCPK